MADDDFSEFVLRTWPHLDRIALALTGSRHDADDLLQNSFAKAYKAWPKMQQMEWPEAYARRILVNESTSTWRLRWRQRERPTAAPPDTGADAPQEAYATRDFVWHAIQRLPARQRAVLVLRYYEDLDVRETADVLDISTGTVKSQCKAALDKLRLALGEAPTTKAELR
ncbi:MAG: SigE family RNA polymerase sigma factor [Actinomycetia bacterium]|nr:SigE family RNA polymerase sigma factor [Actinomycetes bacterium]